jgi:hypothetical protein
MLHLRRALPGGGGRQHAAFVTRLPIIFYASIFAEHNAAQQYVWLVFVHAQTRAIPVFFRLDRCFSHSPPRERC